MQEPAAPSRAKRTPQPTVWRSADLFAVGVLLLRQVAVMIHIAAGKITAQPFVVLDIIRGQIAVIVDIQRQKVRVFGGRLLDLRTARRPQIR